MTFIDQFSWSKLKTVCFYSKMEHTLNHFHLCASFVVDSCHPHPSPLLPRSLPHCCLSSQLIQYHRNSYPLNWPTVRSQQPLFDVLRGFPKYALVTITWLSLEQIRRQNGGLQLNGLFRFVVKRAKIYWKSAAFPLSSTHSVRGV